MTTVRARQRFRDFFIFAAYFFLRVFAIFTASWIFVYRLFVTILLFCVLYPLLPDMRPVSCLSCFFYLLLLVYVKLRVYHVAAAVV